MKAKRGRENTVAAPAGSCLETPSAYSANTQHSAISVSTLKLVFLQDWWLIKSDKGSKEARLGIGGFSSKENKGIRVFSSAAIAKRHDAVTLMTVDGIVVTIHGHLNRSRTHANGFPPEVYDHFVIGFPYYWEEFATLSFESGLCKSPPRADDSSSCDNPKRNRPVKTKTTKSSSIPHSTPSKGNGSKSHEVTGHSGPMTRSRSKLGRATRSNQFIHMEL